MNWFLTLFYENIRFVLFCYNPNMYQKAPFRVHIDCYMYPKTPFRVHIKTEHVSRRAPIKVVMVCSTKKCYTLQR